MGNPDRVRVTGPLAAFNSGFAAELVRLGYRPNAAANQLQLMAHLSRWMTQCGLTADGLTASVLADFLAARRAAGYRLWLSPKALSPLLTYLRGLGAVPAETEPQPGGAVETLLARYRAYLVRERGLSPSTAGLYAHLTSPLLARRMAGGELDLGLLTSADVIGFVRASCPGRAVGTAKLVVTAVRSLLGFLHVEGVIGSSLAPAVPSVAGGTRLGLPRGLDRDAVRRLLACCDRTTPMGRRNYAMLVLLARLGLRPGEVASLRLDDIDWRAGELAVTGKGHRIERLPLPVDVGEAVAEYLRDGRPATAESRTVFVRYRAPHRSLSVSGVTDTVNRTAQRAGLGPVRARQLRHTAATAMVRAGAALPEVGQVLRHRHLLSTSIYAKVDTEGLRELARPWPGGAA
ncbi:site-specific integrase [Mycobacterium sp. 29Ha]|uniref:site-specific integrase n=1 Tax=Mycobacterium sp. 29Ha TaxID=2939268 RepID=UPI002938FB33|nr:site-specific integrase [Mycobacterium sp. 29Ha]MDV3136825.1 site-specific integrase [Mycobacterium sp. 29Ha]